MRTAKNRIVGAIVVLVCLVCVVVIYQLTVGRKVSSPAPETPGVDHGPSASAPSHARPATDEEAVTRPATDKRPHPPDGK
jgi:hypothetical protein